MTALLLLALLLTGVPLGIAFTWIVFLNKEAWAFDWVSMPSTVFYALQSFPLLAIPLFILGGELMNRGGIVKTLIELSDTLLAKVRAPMGHVMVAASTMMGLMTGSSLATVAAIGRAVGPEMLRRGYPAGYVGALNAASGLLGVLLPPSIPVILYGAAVGVSITELFVASVLPACVVILLYMLTHSILARRVLKDGMEQHEASDGSGIILNKKSFRRVLMAALPALVLPVIILGGIYTGAFTPTEAAAVAVFYAVALAMCKRMMSLSTFKEVLLRACLTSSAVLFVIGFTSIFSKAMIFEQVPQQIAAWATNFTDSPILFLLMVNLALLVIGMFIEITVGTILMGPLLAPAAAQFGIDPVHFGLIVVFNLEIGILTPPLATNIFVAAQANKIPVVQIFRHIGWFLMVLLFVLGMITYWSDFVMWYRLF